MDTPETAALALGKLIGTVDSLVRTLDEQNKSSAKYREEQNIAAAKSRDEFMEVFKGIRSDSKEQAKLLQDHMKEDSDNHNSLVEVMTWKKDAEPKVDNLWDNQNRQNGVMVACGIMGSVVGGAIVASIEFFKK
jgi:hypothetical protein